MGFLQRVTVAGARAVPVRQTRAVRRLDHLSEKPLVAAAPAPEPRVVRDAPVTPAEPVKVIAAPAPEPIATPVMELQPIVPVPLAHRVIDRAIEPPAAARPPASVTVETSRSMDAPREPTIVQREQPRTNVAATPALPHVPRLFADVGADRTPARAERRDPSPPLAESSAPAPIASPQPVPHRIEPLRMKKRDEPLDRPMPLPALADSSPAQARPAGPDPIRMDTLSAAERRRDREQTRKDASPARPSAPPSAMAHLAPPPPAPVAPARQASASPGLTIHKLELQVIERPREMPVPPVRLAQPVPAPATSWDWPDRRHHGLIW